MNNQSKVNKYMLILSALPLLLYPGIFIASLMGLAAEKSPDDSVFLVLFFTLFFIVGLVYPAVYFTFLVLYKKAKAIEKKTLYAKINFIYIFSYISIAILLLLFGE